MWVNGQARVRVGRIERVRRELVYLVSVGD